MIQPLIRITAISSLCVLLSGCFLTKLVTMPMRVGGALLSVGGAVISVVPVVGDPIDEALESADGAIDTAADAIDKVPI